MYRIQEVTSYANQTKSLNLPDGSTIIINFYYIDMQKGWFIRSLEYGEFTIKGLRVTRNPNILHQFRNQVPFGLGCFGQREPYLISDFEDDICQLYVLTADEVIEYTESLRDAE